MVLVLLELVCGVVLVLSELVRGVVLVLSELVCGAVFVLSELVCGVVWCWCAVRCVVWGTYLDEVAEVVSLVLQWLCGEPVGERDQAVREVVLRQPGEHLAPLHVRPSSHVDNEVAQFLPVPANNTETLVSECQLNTPNYQICIRVSNIIGNININIKNR